MIGIVDYDAGNLRSVTKALERFQAPIKWVQTPSDLDDCEKLVLPGVGAFGKAMQALDQLQLTQPIIHFIESGRPFLGICLGMQLLFPESEESPGIKGLSIFAGRVRRLPASVKTPHLGWNQVRHCEQSRLWQDVPQGCLFYFAHSFSTEVTDARLVSGWCDYGGDFAAAVERDSVFLLQFHPEKSQRWGLKLIENFIHL